MKITRTGLLIRSRNQSASKTKRFAPTFYFYIFEEEELLIYFEHSTPLTIQQYWAWQIQEVKLSKFHFLK